MKVIKVKIEVSGRHIHLSKNDLEKLFGKGYQLRVRNFLSQKGEFAAKEIVILKTKAGEIKNVRVLGPLRKQTQVEISRTDAFEFKINPPIRLSGNLKGSSGITIVGPKGQIKIKQGVIIAARHLHINFQKAKKLGLKNNQSVSVRVKGKRGLVFEQVKIRIASNFVWRFHLDTDEANTADIQGGGVGEAFI